MTAGMDDFARWLADLARSGTASARHQPYAWWDGTAARLVDAQLPGLADEVRSVGGRRQRPPRLGRTTCSSRSAAGGPPRGPGRRASRSTTTSWATCGPTSGGRRAPSRCAGATRSPTAGSSSAPTAPTTAGSSSSAPGCAGTPPARPCRCSTSRPAGRCCRWPGSSGRSLDATVARYPGAAVRRALFVDEPVGREPRAGACRRAATASRRRTSAAAAGLAAATRGRAGCPCRARRTCGVGRRPASCDADGQRASPLRPTTPTCGRCSP